MECVGDLNKDGYKGKTCLNKLILNNNFYTTQKVLQQSLIPILQMWKLPQKIIQSPVGCRKVSFKVLEGDCQVTTLFISEGKNWNVCHKLLKIAKFDALPQKLKHFTMLPMPYQISCDKKSSVL